MNAPAICVPPPLRRIVAALIAFAVAPTTHGRAELTTTRPSSSRLQFHVPHTLSREGGYDHREALFGIPPYGGSLNQNVYYAGEDELLCSSTVNTRGGYPIRAMDENGNPLPWPTPYILMVDRGGCSFVQKVRNAQRVGAAGVIIADDTCLCSAEDRCTSEPDVKCEEQEPIMADDGSGSDISIPSFLMFKQDAIIVKAELLANRAVRVEMRWSLPAPDDRVEYDLWSTPTDVVSRRFLDQFKAAAVALGNRAYFTPHMYIYDGVRSGCLNKATAELGCYNLCSNGGRYCSVDPDDKGYKMVTGEDVIRESLRRLCIWKHYGATDGVGTPWWDYVKEFDVRCKNTSFHADDCERDSMTAANVDPSVVEECMTLSGGLDDDVPNTLLEKQLAAQLKAGVVILPTVYVNRVSIRGSTEFQTVFGAICAGYAAGTEPEVCTTCVKCGGREASCVANGRCGDAEAPSGSTVSTVTLSLSTSILAVLFFFASVIQHRRYKGQVREQVKGIVAEYMPVNEENGLSNNSLTEEDGEFT